MVEPVYTDATEQFWDRLPDFYKDADANQDYIFKKFVSSFTERWADIDAYRARFDFTQPGELAPGNTTSDLTDPATADITWLTWLAQLVGVSIDPAMTESEKRDAFQFAVSGFKVGTKRAIADAAKSVLTGTKHVEVYDHSTDTDIGGATMWDVLIVTRTEETPDVSLVLQTVMRKKAKPAGVTLWHRAYSATWTDIEAAYPTWADIDATGNWATIEETGL
jgi:hypothetical protein